MVAWIGFLHYIQWTCIVSCRRTLKVVICHLIFRFTSRLILYHSNSRRSIWTIENSLLSIRSSPTAYSLPPIQLITKYFWLGGIDCLLYHVMIRVFFAVIFSFLFIIWQGFIYWKFFCDIFMISFNTKSKKGLRLDSILWNKQGITVFLSYPQ